MASEERVRDVDLILAGVGSGDARSINRLYALLWPLVFGYSYHRLRDGASAEEAAQDSMEELIRRASTQLPPDVERRLRQAADAEGDTPAGETLRQMLENAAQAAKNSTPICQDTGVLLLILDYGPDYRQKQLEQAMRDAAASATEKYYLRPNAVHPITGKNTGNNNGLFFPYIRFHERDEPGRESRPRQRPRRRSSSYVHRHHSRNSRSASPASHRARSFASASCRRSCGRASGSTASARATRLSNNFRSCSRTATASA